jgi:hypothetical protein
MIEDLSILGMDVNFQQKVAENVYPGRGIVMGVSEAGLLLQLYWIMGRSENSRNRVFQREGAVLRTEAADPAKMKDPSLVIYEAMLESGHDYIVSNGDQTRTVYQSLLGGRGSFETALVSRDREPDAPNYTPRITGMISLGAGVPFFRFSILKANACDPLLSDRNFFYREAIASGSGLLLTTYQGDGSPLPSFSGEPVAVPMLGAPETILEHYWQHLDSDNKVALALKVIDPQTGESSILVKNKHKKIA